MAEKIETMMSRRDLNTRDRDFADVWVLSRTLTINASDLKAALVHVAANRGHDVVPLSEALADMPDRQAPYAAMRARLNYRWPLPDTWTNLISDVQEFVDPLVSDVGGELLSWDPTELEWRKVT